MQANRLDVRDGTNVGELSAYEHRIAVLSGGACKDHSEPPRCCVWTGAPAPTKDKTNGAGREVYLYGDRVKDVTTHPAFRNSVRMIVRLLPFKSAQLDGLTARASCHEGAEPCGRRTLE